MAKATGIGGVFFRARDTEALAQWYETHLGIPGFWNQDAGMTVFAPFKHDSDYFAAGKQWMINFRVDDLEACVAELEAAGLSVRRTTYTPGAGRQAVVLDPSGNAVELNQPD